MDNGARADCWTNTNSDAQRWVVTDAGNGVYTLTNVASGKLLHTAAAPADSVNVDQSSDTNSNDVKWIIKRSRNGSYSLKPAADQSFSLSLRAGGAVDGANVNLAKSSAAG